MRIECAARPEDAGRRADTVLSDLLEGQTRSGVQKLLAAGAVTRAGRPVSKNDRVSAGDVFSVEIPEPESDRAVAQDIPLEIVFEDADLIVVNKPQGMVVHPAPGNYTGTLVNALLWYCGDTLSGINGARRPGILHRIDKDTSGLLLVAKTDLAHQRLSAQIQAHSLTRAYKALVHGNFAQTTGTIHAPIGRHPVDRKKMTIMAQHGRDAVTHYRVLERYGRYTLLECILETGRTHQIRVHMSQSGHPIVGDPVYGVKKEAFALNGQLLHAYKIGFVHPVTNSYMEFQSPLPDYFQKIIKNLRK